MNPNMTPITSDQALAIEDLARKNQPYAPAFTTIRTMLTMGQRNFVAYVWGQLADQSAWVDAWFAIRNGLVSENGEVLFNAVDPYDDSQ